MAKSTVKRIAYLFGAGATHAELENLRPDLVVEREGLLISHVSARVIEKARQDSSYFKDMETVTATKGSLNIELLISLIENSKINAGRKDSTSEKFGAKDIEEILNKYRRQFYLHKALFELHTKVKSPRRKR